MRARKAYAMKAKLAIREALLIQRQVRNLYEIKLTQRLRRLKGEELKYAKKLDKMIEAEGGVNDKREDWR